MPRSLSNAKIYSINSSLFGHCKPHETYPDMHMQCHINDGQVMHIYMKTRDFSRKVRWEAKRETADSGLVM